MKKGICLLLVFVLVLGGVSPVLAEGTPISRDDVTQIVKALGIMQGYPDGSFGYGDLLTRAQFAKVAVMASPYRDMAGSSSKTSPFSDVKSSHWSASYVAVAAKNGLVKGYSNGFFYPERNVLYEQAVAVCLRLLGYKDEELTGGYPNGQLNMANSIGLSDAVGGVRGKPLTREATARLIYNLLAAKPKAGTGQASAPATYYQALGYTLTGGALTAEAVVSQNLTGPVAVTAVGQEKTLGLDLTKVAVYKDGQSAKVSDVLVGDVVYYNKNSNLLWIYGEKVTGTLSAVAPSVQSPASVTVDGKAYNLSTPVSQKAFGTGGITTGQVVTLTLDRDGGAGYAVLAFSGPQVYLSSNDLGGLGLSLSTAVIYRNDKRVGASDLVPYDLIYYNTEQNSVWAYDKKVTGRPVAIQPNRISPTSVSLGDQTYPLSNDKVKRKFGVGGFDPGVMVTLLLDYSGNVFDAYLTSDVFKQVQGVVTQHGVKQFPEADGNTSVSYYATVLLMSGGVLEVPLSSSAQSYLHKAVTVNFEGGAPRLTGLYASTDVSGRFDWSAGKFGTVALSRAISILEVDDKNNYGAVYPERLDGVTIARANVLFAAKNAAGGIDKLILRNVTNDLCGYGVLTSVSENSSANLEISSTYGYDMAGTPGAFKVNGILNLQTGPARFVIMNKAVIDIVPLSQLSSKVVSANPIFVQTADGKSHKISQDLLAYKLMSGTYVLTNAADAVKSKSVYAYFDKSEADGGLVRVLIAS